MRLIYADVRGETMAAEPGSRLRNLQVVLAGMKPVVSVPKKEVERSTSVSLRELELGPIGP
jgi:hypothetical protein